MNTKREILLLLRGVFIFIGGIVVFIIALISIFSSRSDNNDNNDDGRLAQVLYYIQTLHMDEVGKAAYGGGYSSDAK